ncbi:outer membrane protein [Pseudanabaena sp. PCC 6802]|uniref:outer membrane protein n=1 Tax=Pseudanabaena sp. PCC 6802 TaxID=118173 RepID=UPI000349C3B8|nr:hypothetical protein [Pseudanabaena sp. PCC 6802]
MFKRLQHLFLSIPLSQIALGCLLTTSAIANPIPTTSPHDRVNTSQETPNVSDRLALEVPNSIAPDRSVDAPLNFEELLADSLADMPIAENPYLTCPTSTSAHDSNTSQPLPIREGEATDNTSPPISCVAHLTSAPTSLESLKKEQDTTLPAFASPVAQENTQKSPQENPQENPQDSLPKSSPTQTASDVAKPADDSNRWHVKFQPYFILPFSTYGTTTIGNRSVDFNLSLGQVLSNLDFAIYGRLETWNNNLGFIVDASYQKLGRVASTSIRQTTLAASASFSQGIYDFAVSYHFGDPAQYSLPDKPSNRSFPLYWFEPILGVRLNSLDASIDASLDFGRFDRNFQRTVSSGRTWLEPTIGAKLGVQVSDPVILWLRGDISGFGLAGNPNLSWNVIAGADWWISPTTSLQIAYRFYEINYGNNDLRFKLGYNGPFIGVTFNF